MTATVAGDLAESMAGKSVLVMAGGTGGHVFPALAVAQKLQALGANIEWLGTRNGIEAQVIPKADISISYINVTGLRGSGLKRRLLAPVKLVQALIESIKLVRRIRPACVLGMGGFASGPGALAAWLLRKPLIIHEQNAVPGLTNRILSRLADRVLEAFPNAFDNARKATCVGNPLREGMAQTLAPAERLTGRDGVTRLLVLGGSLGAAALNETVPQALALIGEEKRPEVLHQTGSRNLEQAKAAYQAAKIEASIEPFIDDMAAAYEWADLVVCRAGAMTVAELAAVGVGSILVPFPYAVDDHQTVNAEYLVDGGAALMVQQADLSVDFLAELIKDPGCRRDLLKDMAEKARGLGRADSAQLVAQHCVDVSLGENGEVSHV